MGQKAAATARNVYSAFGPGTANEHTLQRGFVCKEDESLEDGVQWPTVRS